MTNSLPRVIVEENPTLPIVHFGIAFKSGALGDTPEKAGLSRFTSRLMRRTAGNRSSEDVEIEIDGMGATLGVDIHNNGIIFQGTVIARSLPRLCVILRDTLTDPRFTESEFGRLVRESEAELIDERDDDRSLAQHWFRREIFPSHACAVPLAGTVKSVRGFTLGDCRAWYDARIRRDDLVFSFAGDVKHASATAFATELGQALPAGSYAANVDPEPKLPKGRRLVIVDKPERSQVQILIGTRGTHPNDADHTALAVANTVFGGTFTARLTQEVRAKRGWSYGAYSSLPYDRQRRAFSMWTFPAAQDAAACIRLELELLQAWCEQGITQEELERAKSYLVRSNAFATDTAAKRAGLALDELIHELPPNYHRELEARVAAVTLSEVNAAIAQRISHRDLLVLAVATEADLRSGLEAAIDDLSEVKVVAHDQDD